MEFFVKTILVLAAIFGFEFSHAAIKSAYTAIKTDCLEVSVPTNKAEIDFFDASCKSFGGYNLTITGGDLRYSPALNYGAKKIDLLHPSSFHNLGSEKMEWIYDLTRDEKGIGTIVWKAFIYRLGVYNDVLQKDESVLYVVRLDGEKSCALGTAKTNTEARKLALSQANCVVSKD